MTYDHKITGRIIREMRKLEEQLEDVREEIAEEEAEQ